MRNGYFISMLKSFNLLVLVALFLLGSNHISKGQSTDTINKSSAVVDCEDCNDNCFTSEILSETHSAECVTRTIQVNANKCKYALSHFVIQVPCGKISDASNTGKWKMVLNAKDPKSNIWGLKVDDIDDFGDCGKKESFTVTYTVCTTDLTCFESLLKDKFVVVYKASTCQYFDTLVPVIKTVPLRAEIAATNVTCFGSATGSVSVNILEGNAPYSFLWSTGDSIQNLTNVKAGTYSVQITDSIGQTVDLTAEVKQPSQIVITGVVTPTGCLVDEGVIVLTVSGGTIPYKYTWTDGDTTATRTGLGDGSYSVKVVDFNGCQISKSFIVNQLSTLNVSIAGSVLECHQDGQGELISVVSGGIAPYTYQWTTGDTTQNLYNLDAGRYQVTITDNEGCTTTRGAYVTIKNLTAAVVAVSPKCNGNSNGSATLKITNGTAPYDILWSNGETTNSIENLTAGYYSVDITDVNGCHFSRPVIISQPTPLNVNSRISRVDCSSQSGDISVVYEGSGGTKPYTYWEDGVQINDTIVYDTEGTHVITLVDANGCNIIKEFEVSYPAQTFNVTMDVIQPTCTKSTGTVIVNTTGGSEPYQALWSDGYIGMIRTNITAGVYYIEVSDGMGCTSTVSVTINGAILPQVDIIQPEAVNCDEDSNIVFANIINVDNSAWSLISETGDWYIQSSTDSSMVYHAGTGVASIIVNSSSVSGCLASDTLLVTCSPNDSTTTGDCDFMDSYQVKYTQVVDKHNNCVDFKMVVKTDGKADHELSHMVVGIDKGSIQSVTNSENWKVEMNMTDPKSGVYGFKIDDIDGFGQSGYDEFTISFTVCYSSDIPAEFNFPVVFKAATCSVTKGVTVKSGNDGSCIDLNIYPNPFVDDSYFEFSCKKDTHIELNMYDVCGNKVRTLYNGDVRKGEKHKCSFSGRNLNDKMFFYQFVTPDEVRQGKILKCK